MKDYVIVQIEKTRNIIDIERRRQNVYGYKENKGKLVRFPVGYFAEIPIVPAYALTMHKAQGQTYEFVNVNPRGCFVPGQLYVALSRVKSINGLHLDQRISQSDLIVDKDVESFYADLMDDTMEFAGSKRGRPKKPKSTKKKERKSPSEKGGRPGKYGNEPNRKSIPMKVPKEVAVPLAKILSEAFPENGAKPDTKKYEKLVKHLEKYYSTADGENSSVN